MSTQMMNQKIAGVRESINQDKKLIYERTH